MKPDLIQRLQEMAFTAAEGAVHKSHAHRRKACDSSECQSNIRNLETLDEAVAALKAIPQRRFSDHK